MAYGPIGGFDNQVQGQGYNNYNNYNNEALAKQAAYAQAVDANPAKPSELDMIGNRLAGTLNEVALALEILQSIQDRLLGVSPQAESKSGAISAVPSGTIAQINAGFDVLNDRLLRCGNIIQRLRQAI
jgi:hypothetical protein